MDNYMYINGSLSNQLSQIFTIISYSIQNSYNFKFVINNNSMYWNNIFIHIKHHIINSNIPFISYKEEKNYNPIPIYNKPFRIIGNFNSYLYFNNHINDIKNIIKLKNIQKPFKYLYNYNNCVSLHIQNNINLHYYLSCIDKLINITKNNKWTIILFSNDNTYNIIDLLRNEYPNIFFIKANHNHSDWQHLIIMSLCKYNIISNSNFSWWGAILNDNNNVFYPYESKNAPPEWNKVYF